MTGFCTTTPNVKHNSRQLSAAANAQDFLPCNSVDYWLNTVIIQSGIASTQEGYIMCLIEKVCVQAPENSSADINPPTYTLYISARGLYETESSHFFRQSPVAVLDRYVGNQYAHNAPRWTLWPHSSVIFKYRTMSFVRLFLHIATSQANLNNPDLPLVMVAWARSIAHTYGPSTPPNQQVFVDTQNGASRWDAHAYVEDSPTTARFAGSSNVGHSDNDCDANLDAFVPKILDFGPVPIDRSEEAYP